LQKLQSDIGFFDSI